MIIHKEMTSIYKCAKGDRRNNNKIPSHLCLLSITGKTCHHQGSKNHGRRSKEVCKHSYHWQCVFKWQRSIYLRSIQWSYEHEKQQLLHYPWYGIFHFGLVGCFGFGIDYWDAEGISVMSQMTEMNQTAATVLLLHRLWDYLYTTSLANDKILKDAVRYWKL